MKNIYVIEHLEDKLWPWCVIEYKSISRIVGKRNLWFTNINKRDISKLKAYGRVITESVKNLGLKNACVLDPEASETLKTSDSDKFEYFIFGGILGDYPPRKRTKEELSRFLKSERRNIGKEQLSTDNAVYVAHEILNGKKLGDMKFQDKIEIKINDIESTILPYSYPIIKGKPRISSELVKYLRR